MSGTEAEAIGKDMSQPESACSEVSSVVLVIAPGWHTATTVLATGLRMHCEKPCVPQQHEQPRQGRQHRLHHILCMEPRHASCDPSKYAQTQPSEPCSAVNWLQESNTEANYEMETLGQQLPYHTSVEAAAASEPENNGARKVVLHVCLRESQVFFALFALEPPACLVQDFSEQSAAASELS